MYRFPIEHVLLQDEVMKLAEYEHPKPESKWVIRYQFSGKLGKELEEHVSWIDSLILFKYFEH